MKRFAVLIFSFTIFTFFLNYFVDFGIIEKSFALKIVEINNAASNNNDRWIKVLNDGDAIADFTISDFKVLDHKDSVKHGLSVLAGGVDFPVNSYLYITPLNQPAGASKVFKSGYSIDKTNGYIELINSDDTGVYHCLAYGTGVCPRTNFISYSSGSGSGNSNSTTTATTTTATTTSSTSTNANSTGSGTNVITQVVYTYINSYQNRYGDINVLLPEKIEVPAFAEVPYTVKAIDKDRKPVTINEFSWSFGDGGEKYGKDVSYTYTYPGEYMVVVQADGYAEKGEARMRVTVYEGDVKIVRVGTGGKENFIEIKNNTNYDVYLSHFYLRVDGKEYKLPKNFLILKGSTVKVSGEAMGFSLNPNSQNSTSLLYPSKNVLHVYKPQVETQDKGAADVVKGDIPLTRGLGVYKREYFEDMSQEYLKYVDEKIGLGAYPSLGGGQGEVGAKSEARGRALPTTTQFTKNTNVEKSVIAQAKSLLYYINDLFK